MRMRLYGNLSKLWLPKLDAYGSRSTRTRAAFRMSFVQRAPNVVEIGTGREFTLDVGGGFMSLASLKGGAKTVSNQKVAITPLIQTLILKEAALELATHQASAVGTHSCTTSDRDVLSSRGKLLVHRPNTVLVRISPRTCRVNARAKRR